MNAVSTVNVESGIFLRSFKRNDLDNLMRITSDNNLMKYWKGPLTREETIEYLENIIAYNHKKGGWWAIMNRPTMEFAGYLGVEYSTMQNSAEVQIAVLPQFQMMGLAREALITCYGYCKKIDINKVLVKFPSENQPAKNLAISAGMKFKKYIYKKGKTIELYSF